tara:strand:+ start:6881 stop:7966 length:1086 start_codon:yes stop_codon:yes gene_type:complete
MNYLIKIIFFIIYLSNDVYASQEVTNKVIFKINNDVYTNVDFEKRIKYIELLNNITVDLSNENEISDILDDYISSLIFNYYKNKNNIIYENIELETEELFKNQIEKNQNIILNEILIKSIKDNLNIDLVRKKIIEDFLNSRKEILKTDTNELDLIYNYNIDYIIVKNFDLKIVDFNLLNNRSKYNQIKKKLERENIKFFTKNEDIIDLSATSKFYKSNIIQNKNIFYKSYDEYTMIVSIEKSLESYEGIFVKLINIKTDKYIENDKLNCAYLNNVKDKITFKEYEYAKLNNKIKMNLKSINDYILLKNENSYDYIFLCDLRYDKSLLNSINLNKKINSLANKIQLQFLQRYKKVFNLEIIK